MHKGQRPVHGAFIPENSGFAEGQAGKVGADEGFRCSAPSRGHHKHVQSHQPNRSRA